MSGPVVLFDIDGTLTDTNYLHTLAWRRAFIQHGHEVGSWRIHGLIGAAGSKLMAECIGAPDDDVKSSWRRHFDELVPDIRPFPGATALVRAVHERGGHPVLATSTPEDLVDAHLGALDLHADDFGVIITDSDVDDAKPDPDVFTAALDASGATPDRSMVIGDTGWDIDAATAAGLPTIAVRSGGWSEDELVRRGAVEVHDDVEALAASIDTSTLGDLLSAG